MVHDLETVDNILKNDIFHILPVTLQCGIIVKIHRIEWKTHKLLGK